MRIVPQSYLLSAGGLQQVWYTFSEVPAEDPDYLIGVSMSEDLGMIAIPDIVSAYVISAKGQEGFPLFQEDLVHNACQKMLPIPLPLHTTWQVNINFLNSVNTAWIRTALLTAKRWEFMERR